MNATDSSVVVDESSRLEPMLAVVLRYGSERPEVNLLSDGWPNVSEWSIGECVGS